MTLQFQQKINNKPTHFVGKIMNSFLKKTSFNEFYFENLEVLHPLTDSRRISNPKLHTIRTDNSNRWKAGTNIHFKTWSGKPYHSKNINFAPVIKVVSIQEIEIIWNDEDNFRMTTPVIYIDGVWFPKITTLATNDGFDSVEDFYSYFNKDYKGKIIHWTNLKY